MDESGDQNTKIDGDNNSVTNKLHNHYPSPFMKITPEQYERNVELERKDAIEEHTKASDAEKVKLEQKIAELNRRLADVPKAFEELQKTNAELVSRLEQMEGKVAEKKFQKAVDAFNENEFAKADKILMEIEETEKLDKQNFGDIAYARGKIAEQEIRWKDAAEHYTRAAQLNPCFENLISAQKLTFDAGDYDSALSLGLDAQKAAIKKHGEKSEQYANILNNLASVYLIQKQYKGAESLFKEALKLHQDIFGKKTPEVALSLNNLGGIYQEQKQHREATYLFKRALNIYKESLGVKHPETVTTLNNLGGSYRDMGEFKKAEPILKQALKIRKEIFGDNHPNTATSFNNLGTLYGRQAKYKKAEPYYWQALKILEATLGLEHPNTKKAKENYEIVKKHLANTKNTPPLIKPLA